MAQQAIIDNTVKFLTQLPDHKAQEISDFAEFVFKRYEDAMLVKGFEKMASDGNTFAFLNDEEDLYTIKDLKEVYNAKR